MSSFECIDIFNEKKEVITVNEYSTAEERFLRIIEDQKGWILDELGITPDSFHNTVRFIGPYWAEGVRRYVAKMAFTPTLDSVCVGVCDGVSGILSGLVEKVNWHPDQKFQKVEFSQGQKAGNYIICSRETLFGVKFKGLDCPIVMLSVKVGEDGTWTTFHEFVCEKSALEKVVSFFQSVEKQIKRLTVEAVDNQTDNVRPIKWEDLTLDPSILFMVKRDLESFLTRREWFSEKCLPYRRGYLLHGPPGNGKTTVIRAMLTTAELPAYTMKKFHTENSPDQFEGMFREAARIGGAFIILEDIDRCFSSKGSDKDSEHSSVPFSLFLNCLDGVSDSEGLIVIATANNPKVLDHAILQRPGRFDRVVAFANPVKDLRIEYFTKIWKKFDRDRLDAAAQKCEGMSFAQLREIYIMATQLSDEDGRDCTENDLVVAADRLAYTMMKAGKNAPGF